MAAAAVLKNRKTPYLGRGLIDFDQIWHGDALRPSRAVPPLKVENPRWRRPKNRKIAISRPRFDQFRQSLARRRRSALLSRLTVKNLTFEKSKNHISNPVSKISYFRQVPWFVSWKSTMANKYSRLPEMLDNGGRSKYVALMALMLWKGGTERNQV